jgi:hypothetical protein
MVAAACRVWLMILAHYTSPLHAPAILDEGLLRPSESNVSMMVPHQGPDVVWLTSDLEASLSDDIEHGVHAFKRQVQFTVDVPEALAVKWTDWQHTAMMDPEWRSIMVATGGGPEKAGTWYVVPVPIRKRYWVSVIDRATHEILFGGAA